MFGRALLPRRRLFLPRDHSAALWRGFVPPVARAYSLTRCTPREDRALYGLLSDVDVYACVAVARLGKHRSGAREGISPCNSSGSRELGNARCLYDSLVFACSRTPLALGAVSLACTVAHSRLDAVCPITPAAQHFHPPRAVRGPSAALSASLDARS